MENNQRIIKFRAWDKINQIMYTPYLSQSLVIKLTDFAAPLGFEVMQYTGLKDKNNKEIYEGDILTDGEFIAEVAWGIGKAGFILTGGQHSMAMAEGIFEQIVNTCEVIGNLYENPELIENKIAA